MFLVTAELLFQRLGLLVVTMNPALASQYEFRCFHELPSASLCQLNIFAVPGAEVWFWVMQEAVVASTAASPTISPETHLDASDTPPASLCSPSPRPLCTAENSPHGYVSPARTPVRHATGSPAAASDVASAATPQHHRSGENVRSTPATWHALRTASPVKSSEGCHEAPAPMADAPFRSPLATAGSMPHFDLTPQQQRKSPRSRGYIAALPSTTPHACSSRQNPANTRSTNAESAASATLASRSKPGAMPSTNVDSYACMLPRGEHAMHADVGDVERLQVACAPSTGAAQEVAQSMHGGMISCRGGTPASSHASCASAADRVASMLCGMQLATDASAQENPTPPNHKQLDPITRGATCMSSGSGYKATDAVTPQNAQCPSTIAQVAVQHHSTHIKRSTPAQQCSPSQQQPGCQPSGLFCHTLSHSTRRFSDQGGLSTPHSNPRCPSDPFLDEGYTQGTTLTTVGFCGPRSNTPVDTISVPVDAAPSYRSYTSVDDNTGGGPVFGTFMHVPSPPARPVQACSRHCGVLSPAYRLKLV